MMKTTKTMMTTNKLHLVRVFLLTTFLPVVFLFSSAAQSLDQLMADQFMMDGEYEKASVLYEKVFDKDPSYPVYSSYLKCLLQLKQYAGAEKIVKRQIKKNPGVYTYAIDLGYVFRQSGQEDKAKQHYDKLIRQLVADQGQVISLAEAFLTRNETDYALETYLRGRKMLRDYYPFNFEIADIYYRKNDYASMINEYLAVLSYNESYLQSVQNALQFRIGYGTDSSRSEMLRTALLRLVQKQPEKIIYAELIIWQMTHEKDYEGAFVQTRALDKRMKEDGERLMALAQQARSNGEYDVAVRCYQYVKEKGEGSRYYLTASVEMLNTTYQKLIKGGLFTNEQLLALEHDYHKALSRYGRSPFTAPLIRGLARLQASYLDKADSAILLLEEVISMPGNDPQFVAECKLELGDIYVIKGEVWEATLLYAQVDKGFSNHPMGQEAKFRNARLSYFRGEFDWAVAQLTVLKSATSQLIANDALSLSLLISDNSMMDTTSDALMMFARADMFRFCNRDEPAMKTLDSVLAVFPGHSLTDEVWYRKAQILKRRTKYEEAAALLQSIVQNYAFDVLGDDALFELAELYEMKLGDKEKAKELYESLLTTYPGSLHVVEARKRYRHLRGDGVN